MTLKCYLANSAVLLILSSCMRTTLIEPGIECVWAVDDCEKVRQEDLAHWAKSSPENEVWDGKRIHLFGGRNEIIAFQLIVQAKNGGASRVRVQLDSLTSGRGVIKNVPRSANPFDFVGRRIEMFTESYVDVRKRSDWWIASSRPLPDAVHTGWIPDALVPSEVKGAFDHGSGGVPFAIEGGKNQGMWFDIFIARDLPAGTYTGSISVSERDTVRCVLPVELEVYDFCLPDTTHLRNHFFWGSSTISSRHGVSDHTAKYWNIFRNYENVFHRHRMDLVDGDRTLDTFKVQLAGYYTGGNYTPLYGYDGPGIGIGNGVYSIGTYDQPEDGWKSGFFPDSELVWQRASDAWEQWFRDNARSVLRFKYMEDEPPVEHLDNVRRKAAWIKSGSGVGKNLDILLTNRITKELFGSVTIWMTTGHAGWVEDGETTGYDIQVAKSRRTLGEKVGIYNGQRPSYGEPTALDNFAADARVNPWICWKYEVDMYSLWEIAFYAATPTNAWTTPVDGSLIYTGEDTLFPGEGRGLKGPITSIRMKNFRRGLQDFEYLWLARQAGISTMEVVDEVVPAAFNDYNGSTFTRQSDQPLWAQKGYQFEKARKRLAELLSTKARNQTMPEGGGLQR